MLLIGYVYGIKSEQRLEKKESLNLTYRWFCGVDLMNRVPDHSTFSQNRRGLFQDTNIYWNIFKEIVWKCIKFEIVSRETGAPDSFFLPFNVSWNSRYEVADTVQCSTVKYMEELKAEISFVLGYKASENVKKRKNL